MAATAPETAHARNLCSQIAGLVTRAQTSHSYRAVQSVNYLCVSKQSKVFIQSCLSVLTLVTLQQVYSKSTNQVNQVILLLPFSEVTHRLPSGQVNPLQQVILQPPPPSEVTHRLPSGQANPLQVKPSTSLLCGMLFWARTVVTTLVAGKTFSPVQLVVLAQGSTAWCPGYIR